MATVQIKAHGNATFDGVEFQNFSTEETLKALLDQFTAFASGFKTITDKSGVTTEKNQSKIEKLLAGVGLGEAAAGVGKISTPLTNVVEPAISFLKPFSGIIEGLEILTPEILVAVLAFKLIAGVVQVFQTALNLVSRSITSLFSVTGNLANAFVSGKKTMADYFDAIARGTASIPIIGMFTGLLASSAAILSKWNDTLFELNSVGADFGNSITYMIANAAKTGLSLEQYSRIIKDNVSALAQFGTVMQGVRTYTAVANISMNEYGQQIEDLGISLEQYQSELPGILGLFGASMKATGASNKELAASAIDLTTQFTELSKITGKSREQQRDDLARLTADAAWKQKLSTLSNGEQEKYLAALGKIQGTAGDSFAELYKLSVLGMPPLTKELQIMTATMPGLNAEFNRMTQLVKSGNPATEAYKKQMDSISADIVETGLKSGQSLETLVSAASAGLSGTPETIAKFQKQLLDNNAAYYADGQFQKQKFLAALEQARIEAETYDKIHSNLTQFTLSISKLQDTFYTTVIGPLLEKISPVIEDIANALQNNSGAFTEIINQIADGITKFGTWIVANQPVIQEDLKKFISTVGSVFGGIIDVTKFVFDHWSIIGGIIKIIAEQISALAIVFATLTAVILAPIIILGEIVIGLVQIATMLGNHWDQIKHWFGFGATAYTPSSAPIKEMFKENNNTTVTEKLEKPKSSVDSSITTKDLHDQQKITNDYLSKLLTSSNSTADASNKAAKYNKSIANSLGS